MPVASVFVSIRCGGSSKVAASALKKTLHAAEQDRPDIARRRYWWRKYQTRIEPSRLVFIDETWVKDNMTRLRGWFQKGQALLSKVTSGHWKTITFIAALRLDGITAPFTIRGPINRDSFEAYVEQVLLPTLRPRDVVIMDNLNSHKGSFVRDMIRKVGAHLFFLPAYSPDMNAIEQVFAKIKTLLRKADARSEEDLNAEIAKLLKTLPTSECANYFRSAGYRSA
jgi:transposase